MLIYLQVIETEEDKNKFEDIYQKYRGLMYYVAYKRLHHEQDTEDAVHHAFMKIAENITAIDPVSPKTKQFVVTIVNNRVTDMLRMNGRHPAAEYNDEILSGLSSELHTDDLLTEAILKLPEQHLDEGFLHAALPATIPLDDGSLEGHALEPGDVERNVTGGRGKVSVIVSAAVALTGLAALIAGRLRQGLRLLFQQLVQGFLHAAANQFLDLALDNFLIQLYNFLGHSLLSPFRMVCGNFILPEPASYVFFYAIFNLRKLFYLIAVFLRRFNQAVDHGAGLRATRRIGKEPVLPAHHKGLNAALGTVVAQLQTAILQIPRQVRPLLQQIVNGPAQRRFRRCFRLHLICP